MKPIAILALSAGLTVNGVHAAPPEPALAAFAPQAFLTSQTRSTIDSLIHAGYRNGWDSLAIGERVGRFARALDGAPYVEATLEAPGPEACRITTRGYDCVTFMEMCLNLARVLRAGGEAAWPTADDLADAVTETRYRGGRLAGYSSRLHYTAEWIADNVARGTVEDVTPKLGGEVLPLAIDFMSTHPQSYAALRADSALVDSMRAIEARINLDRRTFVPKERVAEVEGRLATGDLIAITTAIRGLDYSHTGLIVRDSSGVARFVHASSKHNRVTFDGPISEYLARGPKSNTGITVVRPKEPR